MTVSTIKALQAGELTFQDIRDYVIAGHTLNLSKQSRDAIHTSEQALHSLLEKGEQIYGVTTGFGLLANRLIAPEQREQLQHNLLVSHACGVGALLDDKIVRLILLLKINSLSCGHSGVKASLVDYLIQFFNHGMYPCIPEKGSVGASGDLAPLAHLALPLIGLGEVRHQGSVIAAEVALQQMDLALFELGPKSGLALINGTQVSTAIALHALMEFQRTFHAAVFSGCLTFLGSAGNPLAFAKEIHEARQQHGQIFLAKWYRDLLDNIPSSPSRIQDPYCLRCQPQVMGACYDQMQFVAEILLNEANAVTDNPLIFCDPATAMSGGNFHAEPVAFAADNLSLAIAEVGNIAERRLAMLMDENFSGLPHFLSTETGLNSGLMITQVTAASLASENKSLAHPASVDSIPTSANQEDHVSMATFAARRLLEMNRNTRHIIALEFIAACQAIDLNGDIKLSGPLAECYKQVREQVDFLSQDGYLAPAISKVVDFIADWDEFGRYF